METQIKLGIIGGIFAVLVAVTQIIIPAFIQPDNSMDSPEPINPVSPNVVVNVTPVIPYMQPTDHINSLLFSDYFSDDTSGWKTDTDDEECEIYYDDGELKFKKINDNDHEMFYSSLDSFKPPMDFTVEFDATIERKKNDNRVGICFRRIDEGNFYLFLISSDLDYSFSKYVNNDRSNIIGWTSSSYVNAAKETNTIKIKCEKDTFTFYINGNEVESCSDSTFPEGDIALAAGVGSDSSGNNRFSFDNLKVWSINN